MDLKTILFISDCSSTSLALAANFTLLYLIQKKTPDELKPYAKILRQNSLVDTFFTLVIAVTFFDMELYDGEYILFQGGAFKRIPHPWNGYMLLMYIMALYFCISSDFAPFCYRYMLIVKNRKLSNLEFYLMYVITGLLSTGVAVWVYYACWPSTTPEGQKMFYKTLGEFWRDENGNYPIHLSSHLMNPLMIGTVIYAMCIVFATYGSIAYFCIKTLHHLKLDSHNMTERTRKLQKHLTFTLLAQAFAPMCLAVIPVIVILSCMLFSLNVPHLGSVLITTVSWVAVCNPLCVIVLVGPYRDAIMGKKKKKLKSTIIKWSNSMFRRHIITPAASSGHGLSTVDGQEKPVVA